jgi:hypothetical protein
MMFANKSKAELAKQAMWREMTAQMQAKRERFRATDALAIAPQSRFIPRNEFAAATLTKTTLGKAHVYLTLKSGKRVGIATHPASQVSNLRTMLREAFGDSFVDNF